MSSTDLNFSVGKRFGDFAEPRGGLTTGNNDYFLRQWFEVSYININFTVYNNNISLKNKLTWVPIDKGGPYRKWYGNYDFIINWKNDGEEVKLEAKEKWKSYTRTIKNIPYYFKEALSFPKITSGGFSSRYREPGSIHESAGNEAFSSNHDILIYLIGLTNTKLADYIFSILNPTINLQTGDLQNFPVLYEDSIAIMDNIALNIQICKEDWDSTELSWNFKSNVLL
ncbi:hypothetical protein [Latilactobacillus curvatus]|uniref:site-specific DNA-methyltransferase (adenine-specific) n=1 Tax=Latilactobacillus curvatus JCM 1096 = DSM 20019 TaxID=1293592 RepID=A0AAJ0PBL5_LATCU|nr:hypothetical protein [Latilactobacillus curvatus]KRK86981.1 restriction enzyme [Latilactobacillus curvatus JCM 1096 = DSM 20019]MCT3530259.1 hypothetical protein [Latilactobacillus curvatus]MDG2988522.1 hypothetical protein [Latilactobacillus curvatus]QAS49669.1 hypothetical protein LCU_04410 [Latilactobacillus curvatus JCM 1096 = DSM 20019]GED81994.1 hypothetical protein LCU01_09020 [Latilactobacillus curvatus]